MLLVCVTGGLGSGKSTLAGMLARRGAVVVDADDLARRALEPGTAAFKQVCDLFGDEVLMPDGHLDRRAIAARIFADQAKRRALESIVHPEVFRGLADTLERHRGTDAVVVFDAPLILETGFHRECDVVVVVDAPVEVRVARATHRGLDRAEALERIAAQSSPEGRTAVADLVIPNDGTLEDLERHVDALWEDLRTRAVAGD
ncbi:MAG: dephospho-CoA kinase [Actinomycetota bacterium]